MGALCSKESDNFAGPGRPVGSAPPQGGTSSVPKTIKVGGPPRTLGGASATNDSDTPDEARRKAAAAAEARAQASKPTGKLGSKLEAQKKMSRMDTLASASSHEQRSRDLDQSAATLRHD
ncbi:hypothetical protein SAPIO_CDS3497 [Scedosporium apiospermum]|uniref:Uncharacterized protein n=1 Tax=Pseudallescheria apiosperma TaxID=563466 RepID=A0A084GAX2_PSEDA|nr:uncharacterized protein SAPIO_CDS3497 [Scedosporium apiospermum]KEZ44484.1 hypothetical protein SAPIO_CDS3497 [Scedosporium apiospermum]